MSRIQAPPMVWAAMAQLGQAPFELRSFEVTPTDIFLHLKSGAALRVEISSLPPGIVARSRELGHAIDVEPAPETTQAQAPEPVKAAKAKPRKR